MYRVYIYIYIYRERERERETVLCQVQVLGDCIFRIFLGNFSVSPQKKIDDATSAKVLLVELN